MQRRFIARYWYGISVCLLNVRYSCGRPAGFTYKISTGEVGVLWRSLNNQLNVFHFLLDGLDGCPLRKSISSLKFVTNITFGKVFDIRSQKIVDNCLEMYGCVRGRVFYWKRFRNSSNLLCRTFAAEIEKERRLSCYKLEKVRTSPRKWSLDTALVVVVVVVVIVVVVVVVAAAAAAAVVVVV